MTKPVIAVIEDDQQILHMLDDLLRSAGYLVISNERGADAQQFVLLTMPDLIILDLWLADAVHGQMVLELLHREPLTRHIPVIVCSAHTAALDKLTIPLALRGHRTLAKPFQPEVLLAMIDEALLQASSPQESTN